MLASLSARWMRILLLVLLGILTTAILYNSHPTALDNLRIHTPTAKPDASFTFSENPSAQSETSSPRPSDVPNEPSTTQSLTELPANATEAIPAVTSYPVYKSDEERPLHNQPIVPVKETFPMAASAKSSRDLPPIPPWNKPPYSHVAEKTPLFVGFTRNWHLLQQTVVSLLTAGWPAKDIYVVENTGVMDANQKGRLSENNPFYINHRRLTKVFGVNVITTPSLQTFAQLQNLFLYEAIKNKWPQYFWAHMDILVQSSEDVEPYKSFYLKCVDALRQNRLEERQNGTSWALRYFAYDWVTLMNTEAMVELGGWDTMIGYYTTDCDMYDRMRMLNMATNTSDAGPVYDVGESLENLAVLYRQGDHRGSDTWKAMQEHGPEMTRSKNHDGDRNRWHLRQLGGQGEPYYRDLDGFVEALEIQVQAGISAYHAKWGGASCSLVGEGLKYEDQWKIKQATAPKEP